MKSQYKAAFLLVLTSLLISSGKLAMAAEMKVARGAELLMPFKKNLKKALIAGMDKGAVEAIDVCKVEAPAIAGALSVDGVVVGRTSHRLRNPDNAAPDWVVPILEAYLEEDGEQVPHLIALDDDRSGYVEPIAMQPLCLSCHGTTLEPDIAAAIEEQYPKDQATGFETGDLRGVFWVEYPEHK